MQRPGSSASGRKRDKAFGRVLHEIRNNLAGKTALTLAEDAIATAVIKVLRDAGAQ
jgi:hypothetical protein